MFNDMFKPQAEKELIKAEKGYNEKANMAGDCARACLASSPFQNYKAQYEAAEEKMLLVMHRCTESYMQNRTTLEQYGAQMLVYMTRLKDLGSLLNSVVNDAKKGRANG